MNMLAFIIALAAFALVACSSTAKVEIEGNKSVGYEWVCSIAPEGVARKVSDGYSIFLPLPGMGGTFKFKFEAVAEGEAKIAFVKHFRGIPGDTLFYNAVVDSKKNLTLTKLGYALASQDNDYLGNGKKYMNDDDFDKAIECFTKAIEANPSNWEAYRNRSISYRLIGDYPNASADCAAARKIHPSADGCSTSNPGE